MSENNSYDQVNYNSRSFNDSSINHLHLVASLFGLKPPALENAKVLEIGCSMGGNIFPSAIHYPNATFVGIDLAHSQINKGNLILEYMGMKNVTLLQKDVTTITKEFGMFDYIICHGVYSWVPDFVKDAILAVCKNNLKENGIAYVSYNTYPGWKIKDVVRDFMQFTTDDNQFLIDRVNSSIKNIEDAIDLSKIENENNRLKDEYNSIKSHNPYYISHEQFSEINDPIYFQEFNQRINNHGLSFIHEANLNSFIHNPKINELVQKWNLDSIKDRIKIQQLQDFVYNRTFRQSIITHTKNSLNTNFSGVYGHEFLNGIKLSANFDIEPIEGEDNIVKYINKKNSITINAPKDHELYKKLNEIYPNYLDVGKFIASLEDKLDPDTIKDCYSNIVTLTFLYDVTLNPVVNTLEINDETKIKIVPEYIGLAKYMIDSNDHSSIIFSNYLCTNVELHFLIQKYLIVKMDGTLTKADLVDYLIDIITSNDNGFHFLLDGEKTEDPEVMKRLAKEHIDGLVNELNNNFLLI